MEKRIQQVTEDLTKRMEKLESGSATRTMGRAAIVGSQSSSPYGLTTFVVGLWSGADLASEIIMFSKDPMSDLNGDRDCYTRGRRPRVAYVKVETVLQWEFLGAPKRRMRQEPSTGRSRSELV